MNSFFIGLTKILLSVFIAVTGIFTPVSDCKAEEIKDLKENCRLSTALIADTHIDSSKFYEWMLDCGLLDMSKAESRLDAFMLDGDVTNLGNAEQYDIFASAVSNYDFADNILFTIGNHDTWCGSWDGDVRTPEQSIGLFCEYQKKISDIETDKPYFSKEINGYTFIILGSEGNGTGAYISDEQIRWFGIEMAKASLKSKPIFVFLHQPFNGTHGLPYNWEMKEDAPADKGGIGDKSDDILNIVKKYNNVFYISGHIHAGFSNEEDNNCYVSIEKYDGYTLINLPSYSKGDFSHGGVVQIGTGYVMEVYDNEVIFRARNFITGKWLGEYNCSITLK